MFHPADALDPCRDAGKAQAGHAGRLAVLMRFDGQGKAIVQVRPGVEQPLGMARADAVVRQRLRVQIGHPPVQQARGFALDFQPQLVGMFVPPFDRAPGPHHPHLLAVHRPRVHRRGPAGADRARVVFHQHGCVVLQRRAGRDKALPRAEQPPDPQIRADHLGDVERMRRQIAQDIAGSGKGRIDAPAGGRTVPFHRLAVEAVGELQGDDADPAQGAVGDQAGGFLDHLVAGIAVGHAHHQAAFGGDGLQIQRLGGGEGQGLFADDVEPGQQRGAGDRIMGVVRRGDGHAADAVGTRGFRGKHRPVIAIAAVGVQAQFDPEIPASAGVQVEGPGLQVEIAVAQGGGPVDIADLASLAAAHHAPADRGFRQAGAVDHRAVSWEGRAKPTVSR